MRSNDRNGSGSHRRAHNLWDRKVRVCNVRLMMMCLANCWPGKGLRAARPAWVPGSADRAGHNIFF